MSDPILLESFSYTALNRAVMYETHGVVERDAVICLEFYAVERDSQFGYEVISESSIIAESKFGYESNSTNFVSNTSVHEVESLQGLAPTSQANYEHLI
jgi:hypothetical protein